MNEGSGKLISNNEGQSTVEYIILLSVTLAGCILIGRVVLGGLDSGLLRLGGQLEKDLKAGRTSVRAWSN